MQVATCFSFRECAYSRSRLPQEDDEMRFRRCAVALSTMAMLVTGRARFPLARPSRGWDANARSSPSSAIRRGPDQGPRVSDVDRSRAGRRRRHGAVHLPDDRAQRREPTSGSRDARADPPVGLAAAEDGLPSPPRSQPGMDRHRRSMGAARTPPYALRRHGGAAFTGACGSRAAGRDRSEGGPAPRSCCGATRRSSAPSRHNGSPRR